MRKESFINNNFYHIWNRGVDKRKIFLDTFDYLRFVYMLYYLNNKNFSPDHFNYRQDPRSLASGSGGKNNREPFVEIVAWTLMPNHFHLILEQLTENGISLFMHKIGTSYTKYFNIKNERTGRLFEGFFKAKHIDKDTYLTHCIRYLHLNPVELIEADWKEKGVKNFKKVQNFLEHYRWSNLSNYLEDRKDKFDFVSNPNIILESFDNDKKQYRDFLYDWLRSGIPENFSIPEA